MWSCIVNQQSASQPLRIAIIGAGPAGFYVADHLLKKKDLDIEVDMFDRLPTPFGLVRFGVAPDHQKIKNVAKVFDKVAQHPRFRFFGHVELGKHISLADLKEHYHQIVYTVGAASDRHMNIPGEYLQRSSPATDFVAWYNGHPDYRHLQFDLSQQRVAIVGMGNVAVDVARILCLSGEELAQSDIADYALEALSSSKVKEVYILGRRGPAQAAFSVPELKELGKLATTQVRVLADEAELDQLSQADLEANPNRAAQHKVEVLQGYAAAPTGDKAKTLTIRLLVSPTELIADADGGVASMTLVKNQLYKTDNGQLRPKATDQTETLPVGLVFRSVGYRGVPLADVPFNDDWGVIANEDGRVIDGQSKQVQVGQYTAGWIKRGPTGLIGSNKPDAMETVECMLGDFAAGKTIKPAKGIAAAAEAMVRAHQPDYFSYADWHALDAHELAAGDAVGRPRIKLTSIEQMQAVRNGSADS
jgi:ferredoxin--NADP+ reductase